MDNLFLTATKERWRFQTEQGALSVEDLWQLPLERPKAKTDLNRIAIGLYTKIKEDDVPNFVQGTEVNATKRKAKKQFELVMAIIESR